MAWERASLDDFSDPGNLLRALASPETGVTLWWVGLAATDRGFEQLSSWLAPQEHARAARFSREALRRRYVVGRASLRCALGQELGIAPAAVPIVRGPRGRPQLEGESDLDFNISHTEGVALIGIAHGSRIGVDVEHADRTVNADGLARKFLKPSEQATLASLDEAARRRRFLRYWTCKEAMSKATGDGLSAPFRELEVAVGETLGLIAGPAPYVPQNWRLRAADVPAGFLATVALWSRSTR
jgi:4'-phosphopantetheinyl transferase